MNNSQIIRAWKDADYRATLSDAERATLPQHPAGMRLVELEEQQLQHVNGGMECGWVCSMTYDCATGHWHLAACDAWNILRTGSLPN